MTDPQRTPVEQAEVRCGASGPGARTGALVAERHLVTAVLATIVLVLTGAGAALLQIPPGSGSATSRLGDLPTGAAAVRAAPFDAEAPPPRRMTIERIGVNTDLINLRVLKDGTLEVPEAFDVAGWHRSGTAPGDVGPAVLVGHVDSFEGPAVFFRLPELRPGDRVRVERADGSKVAFEVYGSETVDKEAFPTKRVYGATDTPELRLLTCGGSFDRKAKTYTGNVIVYARQVPA